VSRELGIPCIIGTGNATELLKTGMEVTVDCSSGEKANIKKNDSKTLTSLFYFTGECLRRKGGF
jgi:phosphoenolpyruvate synthase/pyruvate phosphate dikinase